MILPYLIFIIPVWHQVIDMIRNDHHVAGLPATAIFQHFLSLLIHGIDYACIFIIDNEEFILVLIALLDEADNVDPTSHAGHKFGNDVTFYDMTL